jgi:predicted GNAT family acetyltransferase
VLETDDGAVYRGSDEILGYLTSLPPSSHTQAHRVRYAEHRDARESDATGKLLAKAHMPALDVRDNEQENRYELLRGDEVIGHATYSREGDRLVVHYVEVEPSLEGRGYGSQLCAGLLADARARDLEVVPVCPFLAWYMKRNPSPQG